MIPDRIDPPSSGGVYAIVGSPGWLKIGKAKNVASRIADLQVGNPAPLVLISLLSVIPGHEGAMHRHFSAQRGLGEWFRLNDELLMFALERRRDPEANPLESMRRVARWYREGVVPAADFFRPGYRRSVSELQAPGTGIDAVVALQRELASRLPGRSGLSTLAAQGGAR